MGQGAPCLHMLSPRLRLPCLSGPEQREEGLRGPQEQREEQHIFAASQDVVCLQALSEGGGFRALSAQTLEFSAPPVATLCFLIATISLGAETTLLEGAEHQGAAG